jgi:hypothetical protein
LARSNYRGIKAFTSFSPFFASPMGRQKMGKGEKETAASHGVAGGY